MLSASRRNTITEYLKTDGKIVVAEMSREFSVSEETIRRDIDRLVKDGIATKTYGGAILTASPIADLPYNVRKSRNIEEKERVAELVAGMINDGDRIMMDASSTAIFITKKLKLKKNLTIITNSLEILLELADMPGFTVLSTGGTLKAGAYSLHGSSAEKMIRDHHVNFSICSAKGIDKGMGVTDSNEKAAEMKRAVYAAADTRILALDSTKFDNISFVKVCDLNEMDIIVTDKNPGEEWIKRAEDNGVKLIYE